MSYIGVGKCFGIVVVATRYENRTLSLSPPPGYLDGYPPVTTKGQIPGEVRLKYELTQRSAAISEIGGLETRVCLFSETR